MSSGIPQIRCPRCYEPQPRRLPSAIYRCPNCGGQFDDDPDEGGDYFDDPAKRLEREEARRANELKRRAIRSNGLTGHVGRRRA